MEKITKIIAIGIVEYPDRRILLSQRCEPENPKAHLKWELPGGKNEFGEALEETVKREILEETGLEVEVVRLLPKCIHQMWDYPNHVQHTLVFCFVCKVTGGKLHKRDHKIAQNVILHPEEALKRDLLPGVKAFLDSYFN